ncbi:MAG: hypothetical protein NWT04_01010, partial [Verrucomicrobiales bacterium]|nr:hypothetical protein [Verrucomicrobiales bacterium]
RSGVPLERHRRRLIGDDFVGGRAPVKLILAAGRQTWIGLDRLIGGEGWNGEEGEENSDGFQREE